MLKLDDLIKPCLDAPRTKFWMAALDKYSVSAFGTSASSSITSKQRICSKKKETDLEEKRLILLMKMWSKRVLTSLRVQKQWKVRNNSLVCFSRFWPCGDKFPSTTWTPPQFPSVCFHNIIKNSNWIIYTNDQPSKLKQRLCMKWKVMTMRVYMYHLLDKQNIHASFFNEWYLCSKLQSWVIYLSQIMFDLKNYASNYCF